MPIGALICVEKHTGHRQLQEIVISASALNPEDNMMIMSKRHGDEIFFNVADKIYGEDADYNHWHQGFTTSEGRFVDREEAWLIAKAANQIRRVTGSPGTLFSEDLY